MWDAQLMHMKLYTYVCSYMCPTAHRRIRLQYIITIIIIHKTTLCLQITLLYSDVRTYVYIRVCIVKRVRVSAHSTKAIQQRGDNRKKIRIAYNSAFYSTDSVYWFCFWWLAIVLRLCIFSLVNVTKLTFRIQSTNRFFFWDISGHWYLFHWTKEVTFVCNLICNTSSHNRILCHSFLG